VSDLEQEPLAAPLSPASAWNIANGLTVFRLLLGPIFLLALLWDGGHDDSWRWVAFGVFFVASYTDRVDGQIARSRNLITSFGKLADPIADKALTGAALIGLSSLDDLPWLVTIAVLVRELGVTLLRFWVIRHGVIPASRGGKLKTLLQGLAIGFYVLPLTGWMATGRAWLMALAVAVTLITGADYVARALRLRQTSARAEMKRARKAARQA
jgi:CDP-diacylglycerol--glycerol-3-phosphate 3-phosphatidyltransferase